MGAWVLVRKKVVRGKKERIRNTVINNLAQLVRPQKSRDKWFEHLAFAPYYAVVV